MWGVAAKRTRSGHNIYILMVMKNLIEKNIQKIAALCKKHKVSQLFVFGSILTGRFNDGNDVDLKHLQDILTAIEEIEIQK